MPPLLLLLLLLTLEHQQPKGCQAFSHIPFRQACKQADVTDAIAVSQARTHPPTCATNHAVLLSTKCLCSVCPVASALRGGARQQAGRRNQLQADSPHRDYYSVASASRRLRGRRPPGQLAVGTPRRLLCVIAYDATVVMADEEALLLIVLLLIPCAWQLYWYCTWYDSATRTYGVKEGPPS